MSQKPTDELYKNFKASFPTLRPEAQSGSAPAHSGSLTDALDVAMNPRQLGELHHDLKDGEPTPRGFSDAWNFGSSGLTPSAMDPNSHAFNAFANQMPGYYTPTPGGTNTLYHSQHAGDLHTPGGFTMGLGTPLSLPTSDGTINSGHQLGSMHAFHPEMHMNHIHPSQFQMDHAFQMQHQQSFAPQDFHHNPGPYRAMEQSSGNSPMADVNMDMGMPQHMQFHPETFQNSIEPAPHHPLMEKFRYHTTLNAPTAMVKHSDEIPITYLNKGQAYTLNVADTAPQQSAVGQLKYRTFVRISFEDEQQRQRPAACWQLWKEGRGTNEAHHRGGRLQAVEYVDPSQMTGTAEDPHKAKIELESASFDGFCVTWTPGANGLLECPIPVRFNFLSTDFSHSKGVKGIPVRLCSKTELLLDSMSPMGTQAPAHEICYCKVKLFRDHGAERKLSNDVAHVKKNIDKLNQQIAQIESGMRDLGKRKRSGSISRNSGGQRPGKVPKHRRTWSMSSATSSGGRNSAEDDVQIKLLNLQDMFSSTRTSSILFLRGTSEDDADLHPVRLSGEPQDLTKVEPIETSGWERQSTNTGPLSSIVSPTPSSLSMSTDDRRDSGFPRTAFGPPSRGASNEWRSQPQMATTDLQASNPQHLASPPDQAVKVQTLSPTSGTLSGWIEALGVDHSYQPPEKVIKPVACFYVQPRIAGRAPEEHFHRAVYLNRRSLKDFVNAVAMKCNIEPTHVLRTVRVSRKGLHILVDDDLINEMPEGQDMTAEFSEMAAVSSPVKPSRQWDSGATDIQVDGDLSTIEHKPSSGYELKLLY